MALITYTGSTAGDVAVLLVTDTHSVTGNYTITNGDTITFDLESATLTSSLNPFQLGSGVSFSINGGIVCNGTEDVRITIDSIAAEPFSGAWGNLNFNGVDSGSSVTFTDIKHYSVLFFNSSYTADNLTFNNIHLKNGSTGLQYAGVVDKTFTSIELSQHNDLFFVQNSTSAVSFKNCYLHDGETRSSCVWLATAGDISFEDCFFHSIVSSTALSLRGFFDLRKTVNMTFKNNTMEDCSGPTWGLFHGTTAVTMTTANSTGNVFTNCGKDQFTSNCLNANFIFQDSDIQLQQYSSTMVLGTSGANFNGCTLRGGYSGVTGKAHDSDIILDISDEGTPDGVASTSTSALGTCDSWVSGKTALNLLETSTSAAASGLSDNGATLSATVNNRGRSRILFGTVSITQDPDNIQPDMDDYPMASAWAYNSLLSTVDGSRQGFLGTRSIPLTLLKSGTDYFAVMETEMFNGKSFFSDQVAFSTTSSAVNPDVNFVIELTEQLVDIELLEVEA